MGFVSAALEDGRILRTFNRIDEHNREGLTIGVDLSLPSEKIIHRFEQANDWRGKPAAIKCDISPENIAQAMTDWAKNHRIKVLYIQSDKATQNPCVARFTRTVRHE